MTTQVRTLTLAVAAVFGATAIALAVGPLDDRLAGIGVIASAYAKDEGGSSGGHTSGATGGSSGGHTSGATSSSSSGGHTSGGGSDKGGSAAGGHTSGGGSDKGGSSAGGHTSGGGSDKGGASGGHASGGGESSGGHESGGGSKGGGPTTASHRYGLERADHGTKPGHQGHASGVHGANAKHGASSHSTGSDRRFGGGSGISGMEQVLEGPARFAESTTLTQTASNDPGPKFRFRYWGGWALPEGPDGDDGTTPVATTFDVDSVVVANPIGGGGGPLAKLTLASPARCDDVGANMPTRAFYSTANLSRLDAALVELDPDAIKAGRGLDPTMMANVQEELVDGRADPALIGSYLGMMSRKPVTPETVKRLAFRLCAPINDNTANQIAQMAEEVRSVASAD